MAEFDIVDLSSDAEAPEKRKVAREVPEHRRFWVNRSEDVSGSSGTGYVAQGIEFYDGTVVTRWNSAMASTNIYRNIKEFQMVHGHEGRTKIVWIDEEEK